MKAFILSAGLGTRLAPLTNNKPKALVEVNGKPMLQNLIERLVQQGFDEFCINIHHFGDRVLEFLEHHHHFGVNITLSDERKQLLDTGGAIVKAATFFNGDEPVLVHNVDVFTDMDFAGFMEEHQKSGALVSLVTRNRASSRKLLFDKQNLLAGWKHLENNEVKWVNKPVAEVNERAYSGIYVAAPSYPDKLKGKGSFSIIGEWLRMAKHHAIRGVEYNEGFWFDLGSVDKIAEAERNG